MNHKEIIENMILEYPIYEYAFLETEQLPFSDKVWYICESSNCERYGKSWACPPLLGSIQEGIETCQKYQHGFIFSTIHEVTDAYNRLVCFEAKREHERLTREMLGKFRKQFCDMYPLSSGCSICDECACPNEPCRHPEEQLCSTESHGIVIMQAVEELGLSSEYTGTLVTYFSLFLYNAL